LFNIRVGDSHTVVKMIRDVLIAHNINELKYGRVRDRRIYNIAESNSGLDRQVLISHMTINQKPLKHLYHTHTHARARVE